MKLYNVITQELTNASYIFTRGQFRPSGIVVAYVCVYVRPCHQLLARPRDYSWPLQARSNKFGLRVQKTLAKVPIFLGGINVKLQGQI